MKKDEVIETLRNFNKYNDNDTSREVYEAINSAIEMLLSDHIDKENLTITKIIDAVNKCFGDDLMVFDKQTREAHQYRQIAYYFLSLINVTQKDMAKLFNRTAGTVSIALSKFEDALLYPDVRAKYERVLSILNGNT